jgi:hypothetical protein
MSSRTTRRAHKGNQPTRRFADDQPARNEHLAKNHVANTERPLHKLKELLCKAGEKTDGNACHTCESQCNFGIEYITRKEQQP